MFKKFASFLLLIFSLFAFNFSFSFVGAVGSTGPNLDSMSSIGGGFTDKKVEDLTKVGNTTILSSKSVPELITGAFNFIIGIFATIILGIIIYAGFIMINSKGKIDSYTTGVKLLRTAIVAMMIVLLSYAISSFIIKMVSFAAKG